MSFERTSIGAAPAISDLTAERLRELLHYDLDTGVFTWCGRPNRRIRVGDVAGCPDGRGYQLIKADRKLHLAHRLAWLYVHGAWPAGQIDHIDGVRSNNRIANLRDVTPSVNLQNQRRATAQNKSSGMLGVSASCGRWMATIHIGGKSRYIGRFDTPEQAHAAYLDAKRRHHEGCTI